MRKRQSERSAIPAIEGESVVPKLAAGADDRPDFVGDPGRKRNETVWNRFEIDMRAVVITLRRGRSKCVKPQLAAGKTLGFGAKIINRAKHPVLARVRADRLAVEPDRDVDMWAVVGAVGMRGELQLKGDRRRPGGARARPPWADTSGWRCS